MKTLPGGDWAPPSIRGEEVWEIGTSWENVDETKTSEEETTEKKEKQRIQIGSENSKCRSRHISLFV